MGGYEQRALIAMAWSPNPAASARVLLQPGGRYAYGRILRDASLRFRDLGLLAWHGGWLLSQRAGVRGARCSAAMPT